MMQRLLCWASALLLSLACLMPLPLQAHQDYTFSLQPQSQTSQAEVQEAPLPEILWPEDVLEYNTIDNRRVVENTTQWPYSAICRLEITFLDQNQQEVQFLGTGFLISESDILTSAHCLYDFEYGFGECVRLSVSPGYSQDEAPFGTADSKNTGMTISIEPGFLEGKGDVRKDCAVIHLDQQSFPEAGTLRLSTNPSSTLSTSGYPKTLGAITDGKRQYESAGVKVSITDRCLNFTMAGTGGQSGSPVFNADGEVSAIYGFSYLEAPYNGGPIIDSQRLAFINEHASLADPIYRAYNPNSGEHVYTQNIQELNAIVKAGWQDEGMAWQSHSADKMPVTRLYNPNAGDHHYTSDTNEITYLQQQGWKKESVIWYASQNEGREVYRLYNPNAASGAHHFTTSKQEAEYLTAVGWRDEGVPFRVE